MKFSPTLKIGEDLHHLIRWSVLPLGKLVRIEESIRSPSSPPIARLDARRVSCYPLGFS